MAISHSRRPERCRFVHCRLRRATGAIGFSDGKVCYFHGVASACSGPFRPPLRPAFPIVPARSHNKDDKTPGLHKGHRTKLIAAKLWQAVWKMPMRQAGCRATAPKRSAREQSCVCGANEARASCTAAHTCILGLCRDCTFPLNVYRYAHGVRVPKVSRIVAVSEPAAAPMAPLTRDRKRLCARCANQRRPDCRFSGR